MNGRREHHAALAVLDARLKREPGSAALHAERGMLLQRMGRPDAARAAFAAAVVRDPTHAPALEALGLLTLAAGDRANARVCFLQLVSAHPGYATGHAHLAFVLGALGDDAGARHHYEAALARDDTHAAAHHGLADVLARAGDAAGAADHRLRGMRARPVTALRYTGAGAPVRLLVLGAAAEGNVVTGALFDSATFAVTAAVVDFMDPSAPLPPHDAVFNAIGDADRCRGELDLAGRLVASSPAPVLNAPQHVLNTGREALAARVASIEGVVAPLTQRFARERLTGTDAHAALHAQGFTFPLLVRAPGFHSGHHLVRVARPNELAGAIATLPGDDVFVLAYHDTRGADGRFRKYRAMFVGDAVLPLHCAVADDWLVHFGSAPMAEHADRRAEDAAFLTDMPAAIGDDNVARLEGIRAALALDYAGIDFAVAADGRLVIFEANATMVVPDPPRDERFAYRRPATERIRAAVRSMILMRARR